MNRRSGFSLVEVVTVMGGLAVVLSLSATLLTHAMRSQSETRRFFDVERHAVELAGQFRSDVHRAGSAETDASKLGKDELAELRLEGGETVVYQRKAEMLIRVLSMDGKPRAREEYRLGSQVDMAVRREDAPARLVLSVTPREIKPPGPDDPPVDVRDMPAPLQVEAVLGRDARFENSSSTRGGSP
jgi:hypothetical protein